MNSYPRRVVVTGMACITPVGHDWSDILLNLKREQNFIKYIHEWDEYADLNTRLGAFAQNFELPPHYNRKAIRSMGRVALMATLATEQALKDAQLLGDPWIKSGEVGISYGSSSGSPNALCDFGQIPVKKRVDGVNATTYIRMMSHTAPVNIGVFFGITGRIITTSSACTSGSQGIGYAYEAIASGQQVAMVAGGAEELDVTQAAVFDTLFATSTKNSTPEESPRPFDTDRDGLVLGEGAATLILEEYEHAKARGAKIYAEIIAFGTNSDGCHVTQPQATTMERVLRLALKQAKIPTSEIGYVSAHGTATEHGDISESIATWNVFQRDVCMSSLKSYMGHTLGACGAIEAILSIHMMHEGWFCPTVNLKQIDGRLPPLGFVQKGYTDKKVEYIMSNNFAFGGINTSLIFKRCE
ncbi:beta-ketoacyl-ACP synthase [Hydromonas duriensis]|uniref:3-oxoacyl-[acyl-carrier-protein] synthase II n=1 Tax=Hydromonas duriensis TaxID=1527608 RepID=A0A4R6Y6M2_9BURK|nr:beta-ketoacyl-ACP synthase [Hydromonas duriensis]TDR30741.1 3-oxoacyl-[acyl-carrier-protein] synthase II [Hydromonas duriensis]